MSSHPLPYNVPVFSTRPEHPLIAQSIPSTGFSFSSKFHFFHLFPCVFHCFITYNTFSTSQSPQANIFFQVQKARASTNQQAPKPFAVVATRLTPKLSTPVTKLGDSTTPLRVSKAPGPRTPGTTRTISRTRTAIPSILKKNPGIPNGPPKRVHFEFDNKTCAALRYFVAYEPHCAKFIRSPDQQSNIPHLAGTVRIHTSNGVLIQERFDGHYNPPIWTGTYGPDGHSPTPGDPGYGTNRHCKSCIRDASSGSFLWSQPSDLELDHGTSQDYSDLWHWAQNRYRCGEHIFKVE